MTVVISHGPKEEDADYNYYTDVIHVDSIINDTEYYSVKNTYYNSYFLKQAKNKVFIKGSGFFRTDEDSNYSLLYDFNLVPGDSMVNNLPYSRKMKLVVDSIGSITIGGKNRRTQYVSGINGYVIHNRFIFVEGIGGFPLIQEGNGIGLSGGIEHYTGFFGEVAQYVGAICLNDTILVWNIVPPYYFNNPTCDWTVSISKEAYNLKSKIKIYPNPTSGQLNLISKPSHSDATINIYNLKGECVYSKYYDAIESPITLNLSHLPASEYFVTLTTKENTITEKIIIVD